jgi:hypothetical protein
VLLRGGTARILRTPEGQAEAELRLAAGDLLVLATPCLYAEDLFAKGLFTGVDDERRLVPLLERLPVRPSAREALQALADAVHAIREDGHRSSGCLLVAQVRD